jgi:membrane associated rhomboid family serine protease
MKIFARINPLSRYIPVVTLSMILLISLCFIFQSKLKATDINFGALASLFSISRESARNGHLARLITANFFHLNLGHLLSNIFGLACFSSLLEILLGKSRVMIVILVSALGGTIGSLSIHMVAWMVGSSTILFGVFGGLGVLILKCRRALHRHFITALITWCICLIPLTTLGYLSMEKVDQGAHAGGLVAGILSTWMIVYRYPYPYSIMELNKPLSRKGIVFLVVLLAVFGLSLITEVVPLLRLLV